MERLGRRRHLRGARKPRRLCARRDADPISTAPGVQWAPSLAWNGSEYLVAWESYPAPGVGSDIYAARVTADGDVLDPAGIAISTQTGYEQYSSVASRGDEFLVVWDDERAGPDENVYGSRVAADGTVLDPEGIAISTAGGSEWAPTVASDGTNYFVAWGDARSGYNVYGRGSRAAGSSSTRKAFRSRPRPTISTGQA